MSERYYTLEDIGVQEFNDLLAAGFIVVSATNYSARYCWWEAVLLLGPANISPHVVLANREFG